MSAPSSLSFVRLQTQRAIAATLLTTLALGMPQLALAVDAKASKFYEDALIRYEKKDLAGAIIQLNNALQIDKNMLPVQTLLGKAYLSNGDAIAAEVALTKALQLGVNRAEVVIPLAQAYMAQSKHKLLFEQEQFALGGLPPAVQSSMQLLRADAFSFLGDLAGALNAIKEARSFDPRSPDSWVAEVPIRIRANQFKEAGEAAEHALTLAPESAEAWYQSGSAAHVSGKLPAALNAYERALKINSAHLEARISRAGLLIDLGRLADAVKDLDELNRTALREPRAAYLRALLAEREGKPEVAKEALKQVTALIDPIPVDFMRYRPQLLMLNGLAHFGLNERAQALQFLELFQRQQSNTAASKLLAQIYLDAKDTDRAIQVLETYLKANPDDAQATTLLGTALIAKGQNFKAGTLMRQALETRDNPAFRTVLGISLVQRGQTATGMTELESAYKQDATQTQAALALIDIYMQDGQVHKALPLAEALVKQQATNAEFFNLLGKVRRQAGKPAEAKAAFERSVQLNSTWLQPKINLARLEIAGNAYEAAGKRLTAILDIDKKNVEAMFEMFVLSELQGREAEAQRWLEKTIDDASKTDLRYGIALGEFHLRHQRLGLALETIKAVWARAPEDLATLLPYARAQLANGNIPAAKITLAKATKAAELNPKVQLQIALLQLSANNLAGAALSLEKALAKEPEFLPAQAMLTDVELRQGEPAKAEKRAREIIAKNPKRAVGYSLLGDVAMAQGKPAAALTAYQQAHQLEPTSETLLRLFRLPEIKDGGKAAVQLALNWMKTHPQDAQVQGALANAYARSGNFPAARSAYELLLKMHPNEGATLNNLANVLIALNDPAAVPMAERAVAQMPNSASAIDTLGWALQRNGQTDRALQLLRDARLRAPGNPEIRYHLAVVLAKAGRKAEAREELDAALKHGPVFESFANATALLKSL